MSDQPRRTPPELLAPAGTLAIALTAFEHGADAVYVGGDRYTLRAQSPGLQADELRELISHAHALARRVYLALNSMPADSDLPGLERYLDSLDGGALPDAFIVSDPGVLSMVRRRHPGVACHLSTQAGACNRESLAFWAGQGISRAVLPRELSVEDIRTLTAESPIETEVFIHGAMCVSVSGRCLLGAYLAGRHPNRGDCPQPCRLAYRLEPRDDTTAGAIDAVEDGHGAYLLNARDLNALPVLAGIVQTGVSALKIEGRTKSEHYVSVVTAVYREALDACLADPGAYEVRPQWQEELERLDHRPYTTGFYGDEYLLQAVHAPKRAGGYRLVGVVREVLRHGRVAVEVKNTFRPGQELVVLPGRPGRSPHQVQFSALETLNGDRLERVTANSVVAGTPDRALHRGDMLRLDLTDS